MAPTGLNAVGGVLHRTVDDEDQDVNAVHDNLLNEAWKDWPNKAAFDGLEEHRGPIDLAVKGYIPAWAAGVLYRTGPGQNKVEDTVRGTHHVSHWFDGFAHNHKFDIVAAPGAEGTASVQYSSRRQSEDFVARIKAQGWRSSPSFGQKADPCVGIFAKVMSVFEPKSHNNNVVVQTNLAGYAAKAPAGAGLRTGTGNVYISTDNAVMQEVHPDTLEPLGRSRQVALHPDLRGPMSCSHAQRDPETGDVFNFNLEFARTATYRIFRVNAATGATDILATVADPGLKAAYIHSLFLTDSYVVLGVPSSHFGWNGLKIVWERNLLDAIKPFDKNEATRWIVIDRRHGKGVVARFTTPASFFFHSINAFEEVVVDETNVERTDICMDYVLYDNTDVLFNFYYDVILDRDDAAKKRWLQNQRYKTFHPRMVRQRFRMPQPSSAPAPGWSAAAEEVLSIPSPHAGEMPSINPARAGRPHRYVYTITSRGLSTFMDSIVKTDLHTRDAVIWSGPRGHSPSEPIFVARPGGEDEDDGVLLSVVLDGAAEASYLLCLDARTLQEVGRAETGFAIPMGIHGLHAPAKV